MEEGRGMNRGDVSAEGIERSQSGEVGVRVARRFIEGACRVDEGGIKGVPWDKWDGERLRGGLEELVPQLPELCPGWRPVRRQQ